MSDFEEEPTQRTKPWLRKSTSYLSVTYHQIPNNIPARFRKLDQRFKSAEGLPGLQKLYPAVQCPANLRPTDALWGREDGATSSLTDRRLSEAFEVALK